MQAPPEPLAGEEIGDKEPMQTRTSAGRDFQENVLVRLVDGREVATIYLRNRMSLRGRILEYDAYVLLLEPLDGSPPQLVYKSAIVSISGPRRFGPSRPDHGRGGGPREGGGFSPRPPHRGWGGPEGPHDSHPHPGEGPGRPPQEPPAPQPPQP